MLQESGCKVGLYPWILDTSCNSVVGTLHAIISCMLPITILYMVIRTEGQQRNQGTRLTIPIIYKATTDDHWYLCSMLVNTTSTKCYFLYFNISVSLIKVVHLKINCIIVSRYTNFQICYFDQPGRYIITEGVFNTFRLSHTISDVLEIFFTYPISKIKKISLH